MMKTSLPLLVLFCAAPAPGVITTSIDLLDPSDGVSLPPAGVTCFDVIVDTENAPGTAWTAGGIRGVVTPLGQQFGVSLRYGPGDDPNTPRAEQLFNPGLENRFVTFLTKPRERDSNRRYTNAGAGIAGSYMGGAVETATPREINAAWFANPPEGPTSPGIDGCVARIAMNIPESLTIGFGPLVPPDVVVLFESVTFDGEPGTVNASYDQPEPTGTDWFVWTNIPEPASAILIGFGALIAPRGRRSCTVRSASARR